MERLAHDMLMSGFRGEEVDRFIHAYKVPCAAVRAFHVLVGLQCHGIGDKGVRKTYSGIGARRSGSVKEKLKTIGHTPRKTTLLPKQSVSKQIALICKSDK